MTANTLRTLWRITLPVVMPAVGAALLLIFIRSLGAFEVPMIIGTRSGVHLLTSEIYLKTRVFPTDWGMASAYGMMLLSAALLCLPLYYRTIRHSERYQTITGKDFRPRIIDLGRWRPVTGGLCLFIVFLVTGVPFLTLLYFSVLNATWVPLGELAGALTLQNYIGLLGLEGKASVLRFFWNSTVVALGTATAVLLLVSVISYFVNKTRVRNRRLLDVLAFMPIAIPDIVLGTAFLWFYLLLKAPIYGTLLMPMLAYTTLFMPLALRFVSTSIVQIHSDIEEAAELTGVPWWKNLLRIYLPLIRPGFLAGWFWVMVHSYRELTLSLLLTQRRNNTVAVIMFDRYEEGLFNEVAALGVMLFVVLLILVAIVYQLSKRYGLQEQA